MATTRCLKRRLKPYTMSAVAEPVGQLVAQYPADLVRGSVTLELLDQGGPLVR